MWDVRQQSETGVEKMACQQDLISAREGHPTAVRRPEPGTVWQKTQSRQI